VALESCGSGCGCGSCGGFAALPAFPSLPAPLVAVAQGAASGGAKGAVKSAAAYGAQQAWQRTGLPGQVPTSVGGAARSAAAYGVREASKATGVPFTVPTDFSAKGIAQAGYDTARQLGEKAVQAEIGIPITFPKKFNAKEIGKTLGSLVPTSVEGALDTALTVGAQAAASALTSLVVGAAAGSVVPGLGTVIGIGVALGVNVLKNLIRKSPVFKAIATVVKFTPLGLSLSAAKAILKPFSKLFAAEPPPAQVKCKTPWSCPSVPAGIDALGLIPWTTRQLDSPQARALRQEIGGTFGGGTSWAVSGARCGLGEAVACSTYLRQLRGEAISFSLGTPATMGLWAVSATLDEFNKLPENLDVFGNWKRFGDYPTLVSQLQARQAELQKYAAAAQRGLVGRFQAVTEFTKAAVAFQAAQTPATQQWLKFTFDVMNRIIQAEETRLKAMRADQARHQAYGQKQIQADPRAAEIKTARAGCVIGDQASCARLKQLQGGAPSAQVPTSVPGQPGLFKAPARPFVPAIPKAPKVDVAQAFCKKLLDDWVAGNPVQAGCLTSNDKARMLDLCYQAHGLKRMTVVEATRQMFQVVQTACVRSAARPAVIPSALRMTARYV